MSPLDYLRAMARRRKPATGGLVRYDPETPLYVGGGCVFPAPAASSSPADVTISLHEPTPDDVRQMAQGLRATVRVSPGAADEEHIPPQMAEARAKLEATQERARRADEEALAAEMRLRPEAPPRCPCAVIYSRCHYPVMHAATGR